MAQRAVLFALDTDDELSLLNAQGDLAVMEAVGVLEERWDKDWLCELDKAWDAIHRSLTDGKLEWDNGTYPLNHAVLGGRLLYQADDYVVSYVDAKQMKDVAEALRVVDFAVLRQGYDRIDQTDYQYAGYEGDFEYTIGWYQHLGPFYQKAADADRAVVFTVDL